MSKLSGEQGKHFVETKVFKVLDASATSVLCDENGVEFTVELYAPQSKHVRDYLRTSQQQQLLQNARTNGASATNAKLQTRRGVMTLAHAIKSWHPVSLDGEALPEYENLNTDGIADLLMPSEEKGRDNSWLTDQLVDFFNKGNFVVMKGEATEEISPVTSKSKKTEAA